MAGDELARLVVTLEASTKSFERALARAQGTTTMALKRMQKEADAAASRFDATLAGAFRRLAGGLGSALSAKAIIDASDAFVRMQNSLKVAGLSGDALTSTFGRLYTIAQANAVPVESLVTLYGRLAQAQKGLKTSGDELVGFTSIVAQALKVSGKSAEEASGALLQLGQALTGGKVQAEEYNSLIDGLYPLLQAAAAGLKEAGGDVGKLTALVKDGKVSSEAFYRAIEAGSPILAQKLAGSTETAGQAMTRLQNAWIGFAGALNDRFGIVQAVAGGLGFLAKAAEGAADAMSRLESRTDITRLQNELGDTYALIENLRGQLAKVSASDNPIAKPVIDQFNKDIDTAVAKAETLLDRITQLQGRPVGPAAAGTPAAPAAPAPTINPISLASYPAAGASKGGASSNAYKTESRNIQDRIRLLEAEAAAIGKTRIEQEKAEAVTRLENAAREAGLKLTPELTAKIEAEAQAYAEAAIRVEDLHKRQREMIEALDAVRSTAGSTLGTFLNDLAEGASLMDALRSAVNSVRTALLNAFANQLVAALLGPTGTAGAGFFGALFGGGRAAGGVMEPGHRYRVGERGPEEVVALGRAMVRPIQAEPRRTAAGGSSLTFAPTIDARGADAAAVARIERALADTRAELDRVRRSDGRRAAGMRS